MPLLYFSNSTPTQPELRGNILSLDISPSGIVDLTGNHLVTLQPGAILDTSDHVNGSASLLISAGGGSDHNGAKLTANTPWTVKDQKWNFSCWMKEVNTTGGALYIPLSVNGVTGEFYPLEFYNGNWYCGSNIPPVGWNSFILALGPRNGWTHWNVSFDLTFYRVHLNGHMVFKTAGSSFPFPPASDIDIGKRRGHATGTHKIGSLDFSLGEAKNDANFIP